MQTPKTSTRQGGRARRRQAILRLLRARPVRSQAELADLLAQKGVDANQATLSRDLRELGLHKAPDGYRLPPAGADEIAAPPAGEALADAARQWLRAAVAVEHQVVLKTPPSGAQPLGLALDRSALQDVVGTIAGDDTVLVICRGKRAAAQVCRRLLAWRQP